MVLLGVGRVVSAVVLVLEDGFCCLSSYLYPLCYCTAIVEVVSVSQSLSSAGTD